MRPSLLFAALLGFIGFTTSFGAHIVAVNLPFYAERVGIGVAMIGLLIAAYDMAEIVAKPAFGALADRRGMKFTLLAGLLLFTIASATYPLLSPRLLLLIRFIQGIGAAAFSAVSLALVGVYFTEQRGRAYGIYNALKAAGYVLSPVLGGAIIMKANFAAVFYAVAAVGGLSFVLALLLPRPAQKPAGGLDDDDDFSLKGMLSVFRQAELRPWFFVTVVNMFIVGILFGFLPVRVHALHASPLQAGILLSAVAASFLLVQPVAGILADRGNPATTVRVGLCLAALMLIVIPFVRGALLVLSAALAGVGAGITWTNTDTLISRLARQDRLGATMGAAGSFKEFGDMVGPLLIGLLAQAFGLSVGFVACGALGLLLLFFIPRTAVDVKATSP